MGFCILESSVSIFQLLHYQTQMLLCTSCPVPNSRYWLACLPTKPWYWIYSWYLEIVSGNEIIQMLLFFLQLFFFPIFWIIPTWLVFKFFYFILEFKFLHVDYTIQTRGVPTRAFQNCIKNYLFLQLLFFSIVIIRKILFLRIFKHLYFFNYMLIFYT